MQLLLDLFKFYLTFIVCFISIGSQIKKLCQYIDIGDNIDTNCYQYDNWTIYFNFINALWGTYSNIVASKRSDNKFQNKLYLIYVWQLLVKTTTKLIPTMYLVLVMHMMDKERN